MATQKERNITSDKNKATKIVVQITRKHTNITFICKNEIWKHM